MSPTELKSKERGKSTALGQGGRVAKLMEKLVGAGETNARAPSAPMDKPPPRGLVEKEGPAALKKKQEPAGALQFPTAARADITAPLKICAKAKAAGEVIAALKN